MKNYELLYILPASETSEEIVKNFQDVQKHIEKFDGKMLETLLEHPFLTKTGMSKDEEPDEIKAIPVVKRKLVYPIKHEKFGYYCFVNFQMEGKRIQDIDEFLRLNSNILRHLITEADPMTREEFETLQTLFARKKAEKDKEEAERENPKPKEDAKREPRKEEVAAPQEIVEKKEEEKEQVVATEEVVKEITEKVIEEVVEEKEITKKKEKPAKKEGIIEEVIENKKSSKKSKIKLEELEDKLDEILEDTIV